MPTTRRLKTFHLSESSALDLLRCARQPYPSVLQFVEGEIPPEGAKIVSVSANRDRRTLDVMVEHESFDEVPDGERVPSAAEPVGVVVLDLASFMDDRDAASKDAYQAAGEMLGILREALPDGTLCLTLDTQDSPVFRFKWQFRAGEQSYGVEECVASQTLLVARAPVTIANCLAGEWKYKRKAATNGEDPERDIPA